MRKSAPNRFKKRKEVVIVVDGQCEFWYFAMMVRNETLKNFSLKPKLPQRKRLSEQFKEVKESAKHYDKVVWIVDFDKLIEEERSTPKGKKSPIQEFKEYKEKLNTLENVNLIINNPCLEHWFLLHFEKNGTYFDNCDNAQKQLKKHLKDYDKSQKYFTSNGNDIYKRLKNLQSNAIINASALGDFDIENPKSSICEMYKLFEGKNKLL